MENWHAPPLAPTALKRLPIGAIRAQGWLHEQLRLAAEGLTGHMMEVWPDVGGDSGWLGGSGESWERGPYYARGLTALAHTLGDARLIRRATAWIDWSIVSQRSDGFFGPADNDDWWSRMPMLDAMRFHYEATDDARVPPFMRRYFRHQLAVLPARPLEGWAKPRGGDNLASVLWLYRRTRDAFLLELGDLLHRQTSDWLGELGGSAAPSEAFEFAHGVNRAMGLKEPAVYFQRGRDPGLLAALRRGWERTLEFHGQIQGTFSSDESLHGRGSTQGTELCAIVELLASFECALEIIGEPWLADAIERIAYNALPAILSPDHRGHQYFQLPNQVACAPGPHRFWVHHGTDLLFGVAPGYGCCAANFHVAWPELVNHLWLATPEGGLAAMVFAPCEVTATIGGGQRVTIREETSYPFGEEVSFVVRAPHAVSFPLTVRIPAWATASQVTVNGEEARPGANAGAKSVSRPAERGEPCGASTAPIAGTVLTLDRAWQDGDAVVVRLPMNVRISRWDRGAVGVERGPLVYALGLGEDWHRVGGVGPFGDYEVHPTTPWNYGLLLDPAAPERAVRADAGFLTGQPWARDAAPVRLTVLGKRLSQWTLADGVSGDIPQSGLSPVTPPEALTLLPFGCARLRIAMFPLVR